jgi:hypothetical protein
MDSEGSLSTRGKYIPTEKEHVHMRIYPWKVQVRLITSAAKTRKSPFSKWLNNDINPITPN